MRIVFFGTPELAVPSLARLAQVHDVAAVVAQPDKPQGRSAKLVPPPTKQWAAAHGILVHQPTKLNDGSFEAWLHEQAPQICCLVAYGRLLKQPILDVPKHGFLNVHPSLLPKHRGPSPIQTAIMNGDAETGVTIMRLDAGMDTGDILLQERAPIHLDDTTETLSERLGALGAELLLRGVALVERGEARYTPQDSSQATETKRFEKADGAISWERTALEIHNLVRAAIPWPVAYAALNGETLRILETDAIADTARGAPGEVLRADRDGIVVATGRGALVIKVLQAPGKKAMPAAAFLAGRPLAPGARFEWV